MHADNISNELAGPRVQSKEPVNFEVTIGEGLKRKKQGECSKIILIVIFM